MPDLSVAARVDSNRKGGCVRTTSVWPTRSGSYFDDREATCMYCVRICAQWGGRHACIGCRSDSLCRECCVNIGELEGKERQDVDIPAAFNDFFVCIPCLYTRIDTESPPAITPPVGTTSPARSSAGVSPANTGNDDEDLEAALAASLADLAPPRRSHLSPVGASTSPGPSPGKFPAPSPGKMPPATPPSPSPVRNIRRVEDERDEGARQKTGVSWPRRLFRWVCAAVATAADVLRAMVWNRRR